MKLRGALLLCLVLLPARDAAAQVLTLKREMPPVAWQGCPAQPAPPAETPPANRQQAARLAAEATQVAILGDNAAAYERLARAAELDPSSPDLAYRIALALEQLERERDAAAAYCRYLALSPAAPDADEVRERIEALAGAAGFAVPAAAASAFATGIARYDAGRLDEAEVAFGEAVRSVPAWSAPLYNRAVVRFAAGQTETALDDLRHYLELSPGAADFNQLLDVLLAHRDGARPPHDPGLALATGLFVPGLGHFMTGRPLAGMLVLGSAAGALAAAFSVERVNIVCLTLPEDGHCPEDQILQQNRERPYLLAGIAAAAAIGFVGALDAFRGARSRNARAAELLRAGGAARGAAGASVLPPAVRPAHDHVRLELLRIRF